jgi:hypothetical protein
MDGHLRGFRIRDSGFLKKPSRCHAGHAKKLRGKNSRKLKPLFALRAYLKTIFVILSEAKNLEGT